MSALYEVGLECAALAATLWDAEGPPLDDAADLLAQMLAHSDARVQREVLAALWLLARREPERTTELALTIELGRSVQVAGRFAKTFIVWHPARDALSPVVRRVAAEATKVSIVRNPWPPLVQIQEKGQALSPEQGLNRLAREFYNWPGWRRSAQTPHGIRMKRKSSEPPALS